MRPHANGRYGRHRAARAGLTKTTHSLPMNIILLSAAIGNSFLGFFLPSKRANQQPLIVCRRMHARARSHFHYFHVNAQAHENCVRDLYRLIISSRSAPRVRTEQIMWRNVSTNTNRSASHTLTRPTKVSFLRLFRHLHQRFLPKKQKQNAPGGVCAYLFAHEQHRKTTNFNPSKIL